MTWNEFLSEIPSADATRLISILNTVPAPAVGVTFSDLFSARYGDKRIIYDKDAFLIRADAFFQYKVVLLLELYQLRGSITTSMKDGVENRIENKNGPSGDLDEAYNVSGVVQTVKTEKSVADLITLLKDLPDFYEEALASFERYFWED